ncbi:MAG: type II secretion system F family protein [Patescibacteria group bacterium]
MRFHYIATNVSGNTIEGNYEADNSLDVLKYLANQGLKPLSLKILKEVGKSAGFKIFKKSVLISDKIFLTRYLSLMLKIGTDLFKAIDILIADFDNPSLKALLIEIRLGLEKGQPFCYVFAKYPKIFSPVFVNLIKAGEASGNLENVLEQLSISLQRDQDLRNRIKAAITYPIILAIVSIIVLVLLISFALPKIANVFNSGGFEPPAFSRVVFSISLFIGDYVWIILGLFMLIIFGGLFFSFKTLAGRKIFYRFITKLPAVGSVLKKIALQRFVSTLSALLSAGMPILNSLEITADAVGSEEIKSSLLRISREGISKGMTIGEAFRRETVFPRMVVNLMAISEKAGHIENMLSTMGDFYESEIESSIKSLVSFLEPILLLIIGLVIAFIALSIIVPIYQLVGQF